MDFSIIKHCKSLQPEFERAATNVKNLVVFGMYLFIFLYFDLFLVIEIVFW